MNEAQYRAAIDDVKFQFALIAGKSNVGVVVPAAMEVIMNAILSIENKHEALAATQSLRPMIDYIEGQLSGMH